MNQQSLKAIQDTIGEWKKKRNLTYENKAVGARTSPITSGEYLLLFSNTVFFFCGTEEIVVYDQMKAFHTMTLSENALSDNPMSDAHRLVELLDNFDSQFNDKVQKKLDECTQNITSSDPVFF